MSVLVDSPVWSLALRRKPEHLNVSERELVDQLAHLIDRSDVVIIGPIRQELLSGIRNPQMFSSLADRLAAIPDVPIQSSHYVRAAELFNLCRSRGIAGTAVDLLICAIAVDYEIPVMTTDADFKSFAKIIPIDLFGLT